MSQVNIQNLLSLDPVGPTQVAATPVDYTSSQFQGGEFRPGQLAPLPRSSEEVMFANLSQIAAGTAQSLQTFGNIASQIDRDRINKTEAEWERIDAQDIDPREKTKEFDKIINSISTPITGDTWKTRIAARISKSWGKDSFEKYVEDQFNKQAKQWSKYDGKMGPVKTQEFMTEFNKNNPSLTGSDFINALSLKTQAQLREQEDTILANGLIQVQENDYAFNNEQINGLANKSLDIDELAKTSPKVVKALELAASSASEDDFTSKMTKEFYSELDPIISQLDPEVQYNVTLRLDQFRTNLIKKLWDASSTIKSGNNLFKLQGSVTSALTTFRLSPNNDSLTTLSNQSLILLPDISSAAQKQYLDQVVEVIYSGLASNEWGGYYGFRDLPVQDQFRILEEKVKQALPGDVLASRLKPGSFGGSIDVTNQDQVHKELINFFKVSKTGLELKANISTKADQLVKSLSAQATLNEALGKPTNIPALLTNFVVEFSKKTGISEDIWKAVLFDEVKDDQGNVVLNEEGKPIYTITSDLPSEILTNEKIKQTLATIGYGETELGGLFTIVSGLVKGQGGSGKGGSSGTPSLDVQKYATNTSATAALLTKPGLRTALQQVEHASTDDATGRDNETLRQAAFNLDIQAQTLAITSTYAYMQSKMTEKDQEKFKKGQEAENKRLNGSATNSDIQLAAWFKENYGTESPAFINASTELYSKPTNQIGFFEFEDGEEINPLSDENLRNKSNWVDENGTLTPAGRLRGLRLMVKSQAWGQPGMSNETGFQDYLKGLKAQIDTLASEDLRTADPALLYRTLYALKGLKAGSTQPIGLGSTMGETDNIYFNNLLDFLSTSEIPSNPRQLDFKTKTFMNAFNIAIETMGLSQNLGVLYGLSGYPDNPKDAAAALIGSFSSGDYTAILPKDTESNGTNVTIRLGQFFGFPGLSSEKEDKEKADRILGTMYEISVGLLPTGRGSKGEILGLPSPTDTSEFYVDIPTKDGTKSLLWSKTTHDQKMTFYFTRLRSLGTPSLISSLAYPAAAAQVLSNSEIFGNEQDRIEGLKILMSAGNEYKRRRNNIGSVNIPTITWKGTSNFATRFDPFFSDWSISRNYSTSVPQITTNNPNLQPQNLIQNALNLTFENGNIPSFNELETQMQIQDPRNWPISFYSTTETGEQLTEDLASEIYGTSEEVRLGVSKGLDPADQFVLGIASIPAKEKSIDYFFSSLGLVDMNQEPITLKKLLDNIKPENRKDLETILTTRTDVGVLTFIEKYFPHLMEPIQQRFIQFNLGEGQPNKVRFNSTMDGDAPVLEFSVEGQPYNVLAIKLGEVPNLPEVSFPTVLQKKEGSIRWLKTLKTVRLMQTQPELFQYQPEFSAPTVETKTTITEEIQEQPFINSSDLAKMPKEVRERIIEKQRREVELEQLVTNYNPNAPRWKPTMGPPEPTTETKLEDMYAEAKMQRDLQKQKQEQAELEERRRVYWSKPENQERRRESYLQYRLQQEAKASVDARYQKDLDEINAEEKQLLEKAKQQDAFIAKQQIELEEWKKKQQQEFEKNEKRIKEKLKEDVAKHPATIKANEKANKAQAQRDFQERQQKELDKWNKEQEKLKEKNEDRIRNELRLRLQKAKVDKDIAEAANLVEYTKKRMELYPNNKLLQKDYQEALQNFARLRLNTQGLRRN